MHERAAVGRRAPGSSTAAAVLSVVARPCLAALAAALWAFAAFGAEPPAGQIVIDPDHPMWLKRHGGRHLFISGPGDPEGFLYRGTRRSDGTRDGDQEALIRKLIEHGGNSVYMQAVRSHGGDGPKDHNPFADSDPARGVDGRILDQWQGWFALMDEHGIVIYLFIYDDGARPWKTGDRVGPQEQAFVEALVRRFRPLRRLIWVIAEEAEEAHSAARVQALARLVRDADQPGRVIGCHHHSGTAFKFWAAQGALNHFSMQCNVPDPEVHAQAREAWTQALGKYQVMYTENTRSRGPDPESVLAFIWASAMGGLMPMRIGVDIADTPPGTLRLFRIQQRFFEAADFHTMAPHDELAAAATKWVLADPGRSHIAYADGPGSLGLKGLAPGRYDLAWVDCRTGATAEQEGVEVAASEHAFARPKGIGETCAAWIRRSGGR